MNALTREYEKMPGYIIAKVKITDTDQYQQYMKATPSTVLKYGGKIIVRGGENTTLEGEPINERMVVIEFPSLEIAKTGITRLSIKTREN